MPYINVVVRDNYFEVLNQALLSFLRIIFYRFFHWRDSVTGDVRLLEEEDIPSPSWMIWTFVVNDASRCGMTTMLESSLQTIGKK